MPGKRFILVMLASAVFGIAVFVLPFQIHKWKTYHTTFDYYRQYSADSVNWLENIVGFPDHLAQDRTRTNRPVYLAILHYPTMLITGGSTDVNAPQALGGAFLAALTFNYCAFIFAVILFYDLVRRYLPEYPAWVAVVMFTLAGFWGRYLPSLSPEAFTPLMFLLVLWVCRRLHQRAERLLSAFVAGLLLGVLMLVKTHYDMLATFWIMLLYCRRWKTAAITFAAHLIPLIVWLLVLQSMNLPYYNHEITVFHQGVWILEKLSQGDVLGLCRQTIIYLESAALKIGLMFAPGTLFLALYMLSNTNLASARQRRFTYLVAAINLAFQIIITRSTLYLSFNLFIVLIPLAALGLTRLVGRYTWLAYTAVTINAILGWLIVLMIFE